MFTNPLKVGHLSGKFTVTHPAIDMSWVGDNVTDPPIHACADGIVVQSAYETLGGNVMAIKHDVPGADFYYLSRYAHLKSRALAKGVSVIADQVMGIGGHTGQLATGGALPNHLHFEIWILPKGYVFTTINGHGADRSKYAVDPRLLMFTTMKGDGFRMATIIPSNTAKATVKAKLLRFRDQPSTKGISLGQLTLNSVYPYLGYYVADGYKWAELKVNGRLVYAAMADLNGEVWLEITDPTKETIKIIETIKTVESAINESVTTPGGLQVTISRGAK